MQAIDYLLARGVVSDVPRAAGLLRTIYVPLVLEVMPYFLMMEAVFYLLVISWSCRGHQPLTTCIKNGSSGVSRLCFGVRLCPASIDDTARSNERS